MNNLVKIYLDANFIFDHSKIENMKEDEVNVLEKLLDWSNKHKDNINFYTSEETKKEIENHKNVKKRAILKLYYNLITKVSKEKIIKSAIFNGAIFNSNTFNGSKEDSLYKKLKQLFDEDDAKHIFQAERSNLDYFLTLDNKTILNRIKENLEEFEKLNLKIKISSPSDLINELKLE